MSVVNDVAFVQFVGTKAFEEVKLDRIVLATTPYPTSIYACVYFS